MALEIPNTDRNCRMALEFPNSARNYQMTLESARSCIVNILRCDESALKSRGDIDGSISPLIVFFFSIILFLTFLISNISATYIARRDLMNRVEYALSSAVREIDEFKYYYGNPLTDFLAQDAINKGVLKVPVDCADAGSKFSQELKISAPKIRKFELRNSEILDGAKIREFSCDGYELLATVSEEFPLPFQLKVFGLRTFTNVVRVGSASIYQNNN